MALAIAVGAKESSKAPLSNGATRLVTLESNRYDYWDVAFERSSRAGARRRRRRLGGRLAALSADQRRRPGAHSLPLQTLAELGIVGILLLIAFLAGIGLSARDALRRAPALAAGPIAGFVVYVAHAPLDWDWQMPAVTLAGIVIAGALLALASRSLQDPEPRRMSRRRDHVRWSPMIGPRDDHVWLGNHQA